MNWLTLPTIKEHLRIEADFTMEDSMLTIYGESAEATVLSITGRTVAELKEMNIDDQTKVPTPIIHASLLLVDTSYQQRAAVSPQQLYAIPYAFDMLIKPYIKLTRSED